MTFFCSIHRCLHSCCFADKPKLSSDSLHFTPDNNVGRNNPVFDGDDLTSQRRSSPEEDTEEGQAEGHEHQGTGEGEKTCS